MSLTPKDIRVEGPDVFGNLAVVTLGEPSGIDAPPFYESFHGELTMNGSYYGSGFYSNIEYVYSSVLMETQELTRIGLRDPLLDVMAFEEGYEVVRNTDPSGFADIGGTTASADGKCAAFCGFVQAPSGQFVPLSVPWFTSAGSPSFDPDPGIGVRRDHDDDPVTEIDILVYPSFTGPYFTGTIGESDFRMKFGVRVTFFTTTGELNPDVRSFEVEVDVSAWTSFNFRDIRGTYGATSYDVNGIEYVWSITLA